jgi:GH15 family glucan-1,4-alpha-glucosidase
MPRSLVLGNGCLMVALDSQLNVRDFFYPRVGLENHLAGHYFRLGTWIDETFSWIGNDWNITAEYLPETLVGKCIATNPKTQLELEINDAVYSYQNLYLRKILAKNKTDRKREAKLFFSHDFHVYGEDSGDTAMYDPQTHAIIHYKRNRYFLINGQTGEGNGIHEFATGQKESFGREGTYKDAEDGKLSGNPIAQGSVDSTISFKLNLQPHSEETIYYWIVCARTLEKAKQLNENTQKVGVEQLLLETENYWSAWVNRPHLNLGILPREITRLFKTSLLIMRAHVDNHGGIISSCDSDVLQYNRDTYSYVWPRDAAIAAMAFDAAGFQETSSLFFKFCNRAISDEGYFKHKYWSDGSVGSSWHPLVDPKKQPQLPVQLDETALVLQALWKHYQKHRDLEFIKKIYQKLVIQPAEFLLGYIDPQTNLPKKCFGPWEERTGQFTSTAATICAAFSAAAKFARVFYDSARQQTLTEAAAKMRAAIINHLYNEKTARFAIVRHSQGETEDTVDSSLAFTFLYGPFDPQEKTVESTMKAINTKLTLKTRIGGIARYENDGYQQTSKDLPGNPWFICTLWQARTQTATAKTSQDLNKTLDTLTWTADHALKSGILAEQINPYDGTPISVAPLVWSHAEFVMAVCEYLEKYKQLQAQNKTQT